MLGFIGLTYFISARRSMIIPKSFDKSEPVNYTDFFGLSFEGKFASFAIVHIGNLVGHQTIHAVCLTFAEATLLPYFDSLIEDDLLFVPVLAVGSIEQTQAA